jgi:hypothetical protein
MCNGSVIENTNILIMFISMQVFRPAKLTDTSPCRMHGEIQQSLYKPGQVLRVPGGFGSQIKRQSAPGSSEIVNPTHRPPLSRWKYTWY